MKTKKSIWSYGFIVLTFANGFMALGQQMMNTMLPKYLNSLDYTSTAIGVIVSIFSITALGLRPISGALIDGLNKKSLYIVTLLLIALASFGYGISTNMVMVIFFRLLHGAALGCCAALALTMASGELPPANLAVGLGVFGLGDVLGSTLGPVIGLGISERWGYPAAFFGSCALILVGVCLVIFIRVPDGASPEKFRFELKSLIAKQALIPAVLLFLISLSRACINTFMVLYITEVRQIPGITGYYVANAVVLVISRVLFGKLADKRGMFPALMITFICSVLNFAGLAIASQSWHLWMIGAMNALGINSAMTLLKTAAMIIVPEESRGAGSTTCFIGVDIGDLLGPTIAGIAVGLIGYVGTFLVSGIPALLCIGILFWWRSCNKNKAFMVGPGKVPEMNASPQMENLDNSQ